MNVATTINKLPESYKCPYAIHSISDRDIDTILRAVIILLLALSDVADGDVDSLKLLWHSAFLTREHCATIKQRVQPTVDGVVQN